MARLQLVLLGLVALVLCLDLAAILLLGPFHIDYRGYAGLMLLAAGLAAGGLFYTRLRPDPRLAAMLFGTGFLIAFTAITSLLNYLLLPIAGPRIDHLLVAADAALGFDWYAMMTAMADWPRLNLFFLLVYNLVLPQIALLLIALAWTGQVERVYRFCLTLAISALIVIFFWITFPSLGAKSLHSFPPEISSRLIVTVTTQYGQELVALLNNGPGYISPTDMRGLIAFPSYHGVLAILIAVYGWTLKGLRWPLVVLNAIVLISTPVQGGHHLIDVVGSLVFTWIAFRLANYRSVPGENRGLVNRLRILTGIALPKPAFRAGTAQAHAAEQVRH